MTQKLLKIIGAGLAAAAVYAPAAAAQVTPSAGDVVVSDNVEHVGNFKPLGDGVGARVIGDVLYTTSTTGMFIFDIKDAENPKMLGGMTVDIEFENEDVPTNGKILGIAASTFGLNCPTGEELSGCLNLYDVTDPAKPTLIGSALSGQHTFECVFDCTWFYGSEGAIVDARDPKNPVVLEQNWADLATEQGYEVRHVSASPHDVTEVAPGYVVSSSQPMVLMSLHPEHGGSPENPVVIAHGLNEDDRFIHSNKWPRKGRDKFLLAGGESVLGPVGNGGGPCNDEIAAFMTWDTSKVLNPGGGYFKGGTWDMIDDIRPYNGTYTDGGHPADAFGCSVHWFDEHPTWRNGGLVAVSAYEHGTRLYNVDASGGLTEVDYALPIAGATSAPYWHTNGKVFYTLDYQRGMDIWRYNGTPSQGPPDSNPSGPSTGPAPSEALTLTAKAARTKLKSFLAKGLPVSITCSRECAVKATFAIDGRTAKKLRVSRSIARGAKSGVTSGKLAVRVGKSVAKKLRKARSLAGVLTVTAKSADGRSAKATVKVSVKR